ncbi:16036_t:CDS:2 [Entrophospora sp. SA101]|nr:16036_t:CDS:2 [Entrophospora sp. SA101]
MQTNTNKHILSYILYDTNVGLSVMEDKTIKVQISNSEYRDFITQKLESDKNNGLNDYTPCPTMNVYDLEGNVAESEKDFCDTSTNVENTSERKRKQESSVIFDNEMQETRPEKAEIDNEIHLEALETGGKER